MITIAVLEVNLSAIKNNFASIKRLLKYNQKLCVVAKANCYGLGARRICEMFNDYADYFAVSSAKEFFEIKMFVTKPIIILDPVYNDVKKLIKAGAELVISNKFSLEKILKEVASVKEKAKVHIAINTGMNRFGFNSKNEIVEVVDIIKKSQKIIISGVFSHYFDAKTQEFANLQYKKFFNVKNFCVSKLDLNVVYHLAGSDGILYKNDFDMVRAGMLLYTDKSYQTITLKSNILELQTLRKNDTAGYGGIFRAEHNTKLAIVGIGYGDGIIRNIVKKGYVLINNCFAKIVAICMDTMLVDVTNIDVKIYDEVVLIGKQKDKQIFICDMSNWCDTIDYEIIVRLSDRIERRYIE